MPTCMFFVQKNIVVFTNLLAVKFEEVLGCVDYLSGKFCVILLVMCLFVCF